LNRVPKVKIFDEEYQLKADVVKLDAFSAHADQEELLEYVFRIKKSLKKVFLVHGEEKASFTLAQKIKEKGVEVIRPEPGDEFSP